MPHTNRPHRRPRTGSGRRIHVVIRVVAGREKEERQKRGETTRAVGHTDILADGGPSGNIDDPPGAAARASRRWLLTREQRAHAGAT